MLLFLAASFRKCSMAGDRSRCAVTSTRDKLVHLAAIPSFSEHGDEPPSISNSEKFGSMSAPSAKEGWVPSFSYLEAMKDRVQRLTQSESEYLLKFFSNELQSFQLTPMFGNRVRTSVVSTCSCISRIMDNTGQWETHAQWDSPQTTISLSATVQALLDTEWSGDAFQTPVLVRTLAAMHKAPGTGNDLMKHPKYVLAVQQVLEQRSRLSQHREQEQSAFLRHENALALLALLEHEHMIPADVAAQDISYALERAILVSFDELSRQLAFYFSGDSTNFDVVVLAYSLLTYYKSSQSVVTTVRAEKDGRSSSATPSTNMELVKVALRVVFNRQYRDGTFRKGESIVRGSTGSRDIGNSYVFFMDLVGEMLDTLPSFLLASYLPNLERCLSWAENNVIREMIPADCNALGECDGPILTGWRSNFVQGGSAAWSTASVFQFLGKLDECIRVLSTNEILLEFKGKTRMDVALESGVPLAENGPTLGAWDRLMDADIPPTTLKTELFNRVISPQLRKQGGAESMLPSSPAIQIQIQGQKERGREMDKNDGNNGNSDRLSGPSAAVYSLILFGPPGTAKTTIATSLASAISWNFLTIDTSTFLASGMGNIASRMSYVFDRLKGIENTVILFDEIEEFCLDRENPSLAMESRLLTTAMLTLLNTLRREQKNIFIVATNRLKSFDAAVIRPGRFDMLLFVGTPNKVARQERLRQKLLPLVVTGSGTGTGVSGDRPDDTLVEVDVMVQNQAQSLRGGFITAVAASRAQKVLSEIWDEYWSTLRFATYAENEALMGEVKELVLRGDLTKEKVLQRLEIIQRTATVQGAVRDDYIESEGLSRL